MIEYDKFRRGTVDKKEKESKTIIIRDDLQVIPNIYALQRIGAGHDGYVFRLGNKVLKLLKYDIEHRKVKGLMTFQKAVHFKDELDLKRITKPVDILLDEDGVYSGYVMNYIEDISSDKKKNNPIYKASGDFTCGELINAIYDLAIDLNELTKNKVVVNDINRGSYIFSYDFMHMCDMDKYLWKPNGSGIYESNQQALNFIIAKYLYYEILKQRQYDKQQLKTLTKWVKKSSNSKTFLKDLRKEIGDNYSEPVKEFVKYKSDKIF